MTPPAGMDTCGQMFREKERLSNLTDPSPGFQKSEMGRLKSVAKPWWEELHSGHYVITLRPPLIGP